MDDKYNQEVKVFKALSDENRLAILEMLGSGEKCACVLLKKLNIGQPTLSHHMKILCESGLVNSRQEGKWTHYSLSTDGCGHVKTFVENLSILSVKSESEDNPVCN